jgi:hypothetical protein
VGQVTAKVESRNEPARVGLTGGCRKLGMHGSLRLQSGKRAGKANERHAAAAGILACCGAGLPARRALAGLAKRVGYAGITSGRPEAALHGSQDGCRYPPAVAAGIPARCGAGLPARRALAGRARRVGYAGIASGRPEAALHGSQDGCRYQDGRLPAVSHLRTDCP